MDNKKVFCIVSGILIACSIIFMTEFIIHIPYVWDVVVLSIIAMLQLVIYKLWTLTEMYRNAAFTDPLSGIYNRRGGENAFLLQLNTLKRERRSSNRNKEIDVCVIMIDIDRFKTINDRFGHDQGDIIIRAICQVIRQVFPRSTDICIRPGGDELSVILLDTSLETAKSKAAEICYDWSISDVNDALHSKTGERVTLSLGIAANTFSHDQNGWPGEIKTITGRADGALYRSKELGRNRTTTFADVSRNDGRAKIETAINKTALIGE